MILIGGISLALHNIDNKLKNLPMTLQVSTMQETEENNLSYKKEYNATFSSKKIITNKERISERNEVIAQLQKEKEKEHKLHLQKQEKTFVANVINNKEHKSISRGIKVKYIKKEFSLSFYTNLPEENGGYTGNCHGQPLKHGMVASNVIKQGTKILLPKYGIMTVADRGGKDFNNSNRLDVLIERNEGESNSQYLKRVNNLGRPKVIGYIIEEE